MKKYRILNLSSPYDPEEVLSFDELNESLPMSLDEFCKLDSLGLKDELRFIRFQKLIERIA